MQSAIMANVLVRLNIPREMAIKVVDLIVSQTMSVLVTKLAFELFA
jgi:hypothetical protein